MYLGRVYKHSRWLPHSLGSVQKHTSMIQSNELSEILKDCQNRSWASILTGDSSWFSMTYSNDGAWLLPDNDLPEMNGSKFDC